jgi:chorismate mutase/prephenate dehydratase
VSDELKKQRAAIDAIDERIVALLNERASHARSIGELKGGTPAYRPEREAEVLRHVGAVGNGPLAPERIAAVFSEIMSACRALEQPIAVAYLGPEGTFSEMALHKHFGHGVNALPAASIDEAFRSVESGSAQNAVVPVENSTEGAIGRTLDLLLTTPLKICGEVVLRVRQNLLAKVPAEVPAAVPEMRRFARVYSHPQSLGQCHAWLTQNLPGAERVPVSSNAEAARRAAEESDACAIGPEPAAERYGLAVVARSIEDDPRNMTRFLVLGWNEAGLSGRDRTSIVMSAANRPGAVHELISPFAHHGVSMSRIESRPARTGQWEYLFYVDLEGHLSEPRVAQALTELKEKAPFVKVFGSYPAADF